MLPFMVNKDVYITGLRRPEPAALNPIKLYCVSFRCRT